LDDFESPPQEGTFGDMKTIDGTSEIKAFGIVKWQVYDVGGVLRDILTPAYYIPSSDQRLLSPQSYAKFHQWSSVNEDMMGTNNIRAWILLNTCSKGEPEPLIEAPISTFDQLPYIIGHSASSNAPEYQPTADIYPKSQTESTPCSCQANTCTCSSGSAIQSEFDAAYNMEVLSEANENLSPSEKDLLFDHQRLGHLNMSHLQELYRPTTVDCSFDGCSKSEDICLPSPHAGVSSCAQPQCLACNAARARRRPTGATKSTKVPEKDGILAADKLKPGAQIHVDNYESSVRGRLTHTFGKEPRHEQYCGGTIFYDAASSLIKVYHQSSLDADSTLISKRLFERDAAQCGVDIEKYHADNGVFTARKWKEVLLDKEQYQTLSGSGAHHQNALAERAIGTVTASARAMLLHVQIHWPDQYDTRLWPLALDYAAWLYNHTPKRNGLAPIEIFCGTRTGCDYLRRAKVFGAPVYILDPKLQNGKKLPKWQPRSRRGQFLGFSPNHSSSVGLIRHLTTNSITPQFHYVIDQKFTTVPGGQSGRNIEELTINQLELYIQSQWDTDNRVDALENWNEHDDGRKPPLPSEWRDDGINGSTLPDPDVADKRRLRFQDEPTRRTFDSDSPSAAVHLPSSDESSLSPTRLEFDSLQDSPSSPSQEDDPVGGSTDSGDFNFGSDDGSDDLDDPEVDDPEPEPADISLRPSRNRKKPEKLTYDHDFNQESKRSFYSKVFKTTSNPLPVPQTYPSAYSTPVARAMHLNWNETSTNPQDPNDAYYKSFEYLMEADSCPLSQEIYSIHPFALQIRLNQDVNDKPTLGEILRMPDEEKYLWFDSMNLELNALWEKDCFELVDESQAKGRQIVPLAWVYVFKSRPDGTYYKRKSRVVLRGDVMKEGLREGEYASDTSGYAPVVDWGTIRLLLTMSVNFNLKTTAIDFNAAFLHAKIERPYYASIPPYLDQFPEYSGKVLKIKRSLYGHRYAPKLFYELLRDNLVQKLNFKKSENDHCLFLRHDCILITWVDDALLLHKDPKVADKVVNGLRDCGFSVDKEASDGGLENYLGVAIDKGPDGTLILRQIGLIDRIIEATGMQDANPKSTPATEVLPRHLDAPPFDHSYNYRSVVGMLAYLTNTTRAEMAFAVHQCSRFSANPRKPHGSAIKRIVAYLIETRNQGMVVRKFAKKDNLLHCWVDADYAGLYSKEDPHDPTSCRSRTGYVITLGENPVFWSSRLQTETADSTMAAEYIAASAAMKTLIYLRRVHIEISQTLALPYDSDSNISVIWEDNEACLKLSTADPPRLTPRAKGIAIKYHWFREHLSTPSNPNTGIKMMSVPSAINRGNIMTKPLTPELFRKERYMIMGF
jgi:hypothetical protein